MTTKRTTPTIADIQTHMKKVSMTLKRSYLLWVLLIERMCVFRAGFVGRQNKPIRPLYYRRNLGRGMCCILSPEIEDCCSTGILGFL